MKRNSKSIMVWIFYFILVLNFIGSDWVLAREVVHDEVITLKISRNYLRSFPITHGPVLAPSIKQGKAMILPTNRVKLTESTQRKVVLRTIFSEIDPNRVGTDLLSYHAWTDLMLFCGASSHPAHHLLSRINRTTTVLGECALATLLVTPTGDIATLSNRQQTVKLFLEQPACLKDLKQLLESYRKVEPSLFSFWTHTDPLYTKEHEEYIRSRFLSANPAVNKVASKLNKRIFFRNLRDIYGEFIQLPLIGLLWCESHYWMTSIAKGGYLKASRSESYNPLYLFVPGLSIGYTIFSYNHTDGKPSLLPFLGVGVMHGLAIWRGYCGVKHYQAYRSLFRNLASRMQEVQVFMKTIQQVSHIVAQNQPLEATYGPSLKEIRALLANSKARTEIGTMVRNFLEMRLDNWSYICGDGSRLLATYNLFKEYKDCLKPAMYELGQLDSFMGVATLVEEAREAYPEHCYTFTKFLDRAEQKTPLIQLHAMWHPLLDPATVVDNEVEMDADQTRNMVLCGPNAGGKSAFLSGVASSLLLSQTFGIAPAKRAVITPFNKIHTYIEVGNDMASGASLFMVEVDRMQRYINMLERSKPDEFIFTISDEPFAGTNPAEAGAAAYSILSCMAQYTNALHIVASHYPILMGLAHNVKGGGFRNFKIFVKEIADQKLHYTYKVVPGTANQRVALKILEQEGYDKALLKQAEDIVKNPEKFHRVFVKTKK